MYSVNNRIILKSTYSDTFKIYLIRVEFILPPKWHVYIFLQTEFPLFSQTTETVSSSPFMYSAGVWRATTRTFV